MERITGLWKRQHLAVKALTLLVLVCAIAVGSGIAGHNLGYTQDYNQANKSTNVLSLCRNLSGYDPNRIAGHLHTAFLNRKVVFQEALSNSVPYLVLFMAGAEIYPRQIYAVETSIPVSFVGPTKPVGAVSESNLFIFKGAAILVFAAPKTGTMTVTLSVLYPQLPTSWSANGNDATEDTFNQISTNVNDPTGVLLAQFLVRNYLSRAIDEGFTAQIGLEQSIPAPATWLTSPTAPEGEDNPEMWQYHC